MPLPAFYWEPIAAIHTITLALWIGSIFYYVFGLQSCLSLLDPTQKTSLQLQSLRKLFQFSWINAFLALITQIAAMGLTLLNTPHITAITWSTYAAIIVVFLMFIIQFYVFTTAYRKARRALRPKPAVFTKINTPLKLIVFLGIINWVLLVL
ncbi:hypothetical protein HK18_01500 [Commensalibacter intestini]|nr:hypothetical protein [Commensalibacter intestini]OUI79270.1 hypothetical protein HK18_01500 [Commensalibacter intestini]